MDANLVRSGARWLITGAGGQLGRSLCRLAEARGLQVHAASRSRLDVTDPAGVTASLRDVRPEVLVNCAAYTSVDGAEQDPEAARACNAVAPGLLAEACRGRCLLVHWSTEYVFDGASSRPIPENAVPRPLSVYGSTKLAGERAVREVDSEYLIARTQWVFGPGPCFVRSIVRGAREGRTLRVVDDQIGRPTWTGALAEGLLRAVELGARGTLHLACEGVASWYDLARAAVGEGARRGLNPEVPVEPIPTSEMPRPAPRPAYAVLDLGWARALGIRMPHWGDALSAYMEAEREGRDV